MGIAAPEFLVVTYCTQTEMAGQCDGTELPPVGFEPDKQYILGIDPSTKRIGLAIFGTDLKLVALVDLKRDGLLDVSGFKACVRRYLQMLFKNVELSRIIYERPIDESDRVRARSALNMLRGFIELLRYDVDAFAGADFRSIRDGTWKKRYLADPRYQGRRRNRADVKSSIIEETVTRFPWTGMYCATTPDEVDSADAAGVALGYMEECYIDSNVSMPRINATMERNERVKYISLVLPADRADIHSFIDRRIAQPYRTRKRRFLIYNKDMSFEENCQRFASSYNSLGVLLVRENKAEQIVQWKTETKKKPGEIYIVFVARENISAAAED